MTDKDTALIREAINNLRPPSEYTHGYTSGYMSGKWDAYELMKDRLTQPAVPDENMKLRTILSDLYEQFGMIKHKFERAGGVWQIASKGVELGATSWASNVENSINNMSLIFEEAKKSIPPIQAAKEETNV